VSASPMRTATWPMVGITRQHLRRFARFHA
jgi:hypothetical protein